MAAPDLPWGPWIPVRAHRRTDAVDRNDGTPGDGGRRVAVRRDRWCGGHNTIRAGTFVPDDDGRPDGDGGGTDPIGSLNADRTTALFAFHECSVSATAQRILDLCRATLDDAVDAAAARGPDRLDSLPPMLYRTTRELLDLFRAVVPAARAGKVESIPRVAAVLHNDCVYLAHESSLLGE